MRPEYPHNVTLSCLLEIQASYDHRLRKWRHTDICEYQTTVVAKVPRVECSEHGIKTVSVPWADERVRFTTAFEAKVINELLDATSISTVATRMGVSWTMITNIMERAVLRGCARKKEELIAHLCVDETSYKKGHNYITVVSNPDTATVLYVGEGRTKASLKVRTRCCKYHPNQLRMSARVGQRPV